MKKLILALLCFAISFGAVKAEDFIPKGENVKLAGVGTFMQNSVVLGYYSLFEVKGKGKKASKEFVLCLLDDELEPVKSVKVDGVKDEFLVESSFNGKYVCLGFMEPRKRGLKYIFYDREGKKAGAYNVGKLDRQEFMHMMTTGGNESNMYSGTMLAVPGEGFVRYSQEKKKGKRMNLQMMDNNGKRKWQAGSDLRANKHAYEFAYPLCATDKVVLSLFSVRKYRLSGKGEMFLSLIETEKGREISRLYLKRSEGDNVQLPLGATYDIDKKQFFVYGEYYSPKGKPINKPSLGMYYQMIDEAGNIKEEKYAAWPPKKLKGDDEEGMPVYARHTVLHKMVRSSDGNIYAVGEQFSKKAYPWGIVGQILAITTRNFYTNVAAVQLVSKNIVVYEFNNNFQLEKVAKKETDRSKIALPIGALYSSSHRLGYYSNMAGWFDYTFTTTSDHNEKFSATWVKSTKRKHEKRTTRVLNFGYNENNELACLEASMDGKPTWYRVLPAKPGYVAMFEYYHKNQLLHKRFEKLEEKPAIGPDGGKAQMDKKEEKKD